MTDTELAKLREIYDVMTSGRIDLARTMLEKIIDNRKPPIRPDPEPEVA